jgi:hypothetical protein
MPTAATPAAAPTASIAPPSPPEPREDAIDEIADVTAPPPTALKRIRIDISLMLVFLSFADLDHVSSVLVLPSIWRLVLLDISTQQ